MKIVAALLPAEKKHLIACALWIMFMTAYAQPGKDGTLTVVSSASVLNKYSFITASVSAGSSTVAIVSPSLVSYCPGDLIMIYQAQGVSMSTANSATYGTISSYNSAGLYEIKYVQSYSGNVLTTQTSFTNSYALAGKPQIIKIPQYSTLTINPGATVKASPWRDTTVGAVLYRLGGIVAIQAQSIVNNGTITTQGLGFRGAAQPLNAPTNVGIAAFVLTSYSGGQKGESVFGYATEYTSTGNYCRGAPANGGGGGDGHNSGGGGGSNGYNANAWTGCGVMVVDANNPLAAWALDPDYAANSNALTNSSGGGRGGYTWGDSNGNALTQAPGTYSAWGGDSRRNVGGLGGHPLTNIDAETRIYFGGGGGAADANNNVSTPGGNGGGIIYLAATGISGTGVINANGNNSGDTFNCSCDGASGGGGGGSIVIKTASIASSQTVTASGGKGGNELFIYPLYGSTYASTANENDGPGGGGGGGFAAISSSGVTTIVDGGDNGYSLSIGVTEFPFNGATKGATGQTGTVSASIISYTPMPAGSNTPCLGGLLSFTTLPGYTYNWFGPASFTSSVQNPTLANASLLNAGVYTLVASQGTACPSSSQTLAVSVNTLFNASISTTSLTCYNINVGSATVNVSGGSGTQSYTWTSPSGYVQLNTFAVNLAAGIHTLSLTDPVTTCTLVKTFQIFQPTPVQATVSASSPSACTGSSVILTATASGGIPLPGQSYTYLWNSSASTSTYVISQPTAGNYLELCSVSDANGCTSYGIQLLDFYTTPTLTAVPTVTSCSGSAITLSTSGASTYTWSPGNLSGNSVTVSASGTTIYTVTGSSTAGCIASITSTVSISPVPAISIQPGNISCASLGSATVSASGAGPYSYTWTPTAQNSSVATGLYPTTYSVNISDNASGCNYSTTAAFVSSLTGTVSVSNIACNGANSGTAGIMLTGSPASVNYTWTNVAGAQTSSIATGLGPGTHTVSVLNATTLCSFSQTFAITQPPALTLTASAGSPTACTGSSVSLSASLSGGVPNYTYSWTGGPSAPGYTVNSPVGGTYLYTVTGTDANTCTLSTTLPITFYATPTLAVSNTSLCLGDTGTLTASGANSYTWLPSNSNGNTHTVSPSAFTTYTINGSSSAGCAANATLSVFVYMPPTFIYPTTTITCAHLGSATVQLSGGGPYSYTWMPTAQNASIASNLYPGTYTITVLDNSSGCKSFSTTTFNSVVPFTGTVSSTGSIACNGASTATASIVLSGGTGSQNYAWSNLPGILQTTSVATNLYGGIHTVTVTDAITFCKVIETFTITQPPALTLNIATSSPTACTSSAILFTATALGGTPAYSYSWSPGPASATTGVSFSSAGNHAYTAAATDMNGCSITKSVSVSFIATPTLTVLNGIMCLNSTATLNAFGADTYTWLPGLLTGSTVTVSPSANSTYSITGSHLGCFAHTTASVVVNALPVPTVVASPTVCANQNISLAASGGNSYLWSGPGSFTSSLQNPLTAAHAGVYQLLATSVEGCTASASATVAVLPVPNPTATGAIVCLGEAATLSASGGTSYIWSGPNGYSSILASIFIPTASASATGNYTVMVTGMNSCSSYTVVQLVGNPFPLPIPSININPKACLNSPVLLQGNGGVDYQWSGPAAFSSTLQNTQFMAANMNMSGVYTLSVRNSSNCAASTTVMLIVYPQPKGNLLSDKMSLCVPGCAALGFKAGNNTSPVASIKFLMNGKALNDSLPAYCFNVPGTYSASILFSDTNACSNTSALLIQAYEKPKADFDIYPPDPVAGIDNVMFTNMSLGLQNSYSWYFGGQLTDSSFTKNGSRLFNEPGNYPVALMVSNRLGCIDTIVKIVSVGEEFSLYVPNAFTPNGDDLNDIFQPKGGGINKYELRVFDRWGLELFYTQDASSGWSGKYNGRDCSDDLYVWKIDVSLRGGRQKSLTGTVYLSR